MIVEIHFEQQYVIFVLFHMFLVYLNSSLYFLVVLNVHYVCVVSVVWMANVCQCDFVTFYVSCCRKT